MWNLSGMIETEKEEQARLAQTPVGSRSYGLSQLPANILRNTGSGLEGMLIELPRLPLADGSVPEGRIVVVPVKIENTVRREGAKMHRNDGYWTCVVVASTVSSYPVGGYKLSVPEAELVRGTRIAPEEILRIAQEAQA